MRPIRPDPDQSERQLRLARAYGRPGRHLGQLQPCTDPASIRPAGPGRGPAAHPDGLWTDALLGQTQDSTGLDYQRQDWERGDQVCLPFGLQPVSPMQTRADQRSAGCSRAGTSSSRREPAVLSSYVQTGGNSAMRGMCAMLPCGKPYRDR